MSKTRKKYKFFEQEHFYDVLRDFAEELGVQGDIGKQIESLKTTYLRRIIKENTIDNQGKLFN